MGLFRVVAKRDKHDLVAINREFQHEKFDGWLEKVAEILMDFVISEIESHDQQQKVAQ